MSEIQKLISALKKVETCIYMDVEEIKANFQPNNVPKNLDDYDELSKEEINSSTIFNSSKPAYSGWFYEALIYKIRSKDVIQLIEEYTTHLEAERDDAYGLDDFIKEVKGVYPIDLFSSLSKGKRIYSLDIEKQIEQAEQGIPIEDIKGDSIVIDDDSFEVGMLDMPIVVVEKDFSVLLYHLEFDEL
jgi:hypothetical protein